MQFNGIELVFNWILTIQKWWDFDGVNVLKWSMEKTGWWLTHPSEKYEFVSWDSFSQHVPNHHPVEKKNY